jgi:hypothetical protein
MPSVRSQPGAGQRAQRTQAEPSPLRPLAPSPGISGRPARVPHRNFSGQLGAAAKRRLKFTRSGKFLPGGEDPLSLRALTAVLIRPGTFGAFTRAIPLAGS